MFSRKLYSAALAAIMALCVATSAQAKRAVPDSVFVAQALCVHSGWQWTTSWVKGERAEYHLFGHSFWRTTKTWSNGEGAWSWSNSLYGGGLSFMVGTFNSVGPPIAHSTQDIARTPPAEQIRRMWLIVTRDGDFHEWPQTAKACGLPT